MKYFGFYREMPYKVGAQIQASDLPRSGAAGESEDVAAYMNGCESLVVVPGIEQDPYDESQTVLGGYGLRTDGNWVWPVMAIHLVRKYGLTVPGDFKARMASLNYSAPTLARAEIIEIFKQAKPELW
ncbi:hypothetical protein ACEZCY_37855 [Streptacidiphilus sp. N1-12]|uniref:Uncharacterized protein n=2 Tax=Streptacidiphilus alkalitolerans TaxID=3342712 RepID=A0ABV6VMN3_9ACTN